MRQRKSQITSLSGSSNNGDNDNDYDSNDGSQSDHEDSILAAHPDEETGPRLIPSDEPPTVVQRNHGHFSFFLDGLRANQTKWAQCTTIAISALATYSYHTVGATANVQVAIMTVITLVGASPMCKAHLTTAAIGAFVGGHNIIGATKRLEAAPNVGEAMYTSYLWLLVLAVSVGSVWSHFVTHPRIKLLDGYSGRLGTTTFIGMNLTMVVLWGPLGVVSWNRYYYGLVGIVHVAEEDSAPPSLASAWSWTEEAELAIGYVLSVLWLGLVAGVTRIHHHQYVQEWHRDHREEDPAREAAPTTLNNVLVPVLWALASILVANATGYQHAAGLYNGFAVGAYVGMASLQKIPSVQKFATISLMAALWGLALTPFFVGFAGKSGFTSMMGHVTHEAIEKFVWERIKYRLQRKQRLQQQREAQEEEEQRLREIQAQQQQEEENHRLLQEAEERQKASKASEPYRPPHKPSRKKELVFSTKQQRRQQQRMKKQQQQQKQHPNNQAQRNLSHDANAAPLRHRAWVADPADGDGIWEHPQLHEISASSQASKLEVV